jgi:shikimate kinase
MLAGGAASVFPRGVDTMWTSFIGFLASGKSTCVYLLSQGTRQPAVDLDEEVARLAGLSVPEIFRGGGLDRFRGLEQQALEGLLSRRALLLATGAGCVESPRSVEMLQRQGVVIWLDAPWEILRGRLEAAGAGRRPVLDHLGWDGLERLYLRRQRLYAAVAHFRLRSDQASAANVARDALLHSLFWRRQRRWGAA